MTALTRLAESYVRYFGKEGEGHLYCDIVDLRRSRVLTSAKVTADYQIRWPRDI